MRKTHMDVRRSHYLFAALVFFGAAGALLFGETPLALSMIAAWIVVVGLS